MSIKTQSEKELADELYETDLGLEEESNPKESILPNIIASGAIAGISIGLGYLETEVWPVIRDSLFGGTFNPFYQGIAIGALGIASLGTHFLANLAYMKIANRSSHFGKIDLITSGALVLTLFNGSAWLRGTAKGWEMGHPGYPDYKYGVVTGFGKEFFNAPRIGDIVLPSYAHIAGIALGVGLKGIHLLNRVRPMGSIKKLENFGHRIGNYFSEVSSKSRLNRYALKSLMTFGLFSISTASTGHPAMGMAMASIPTAYVVKSEVKEVANYTKDYGMYALEIARAKAERFAYLFKKLLT